MHLYAENFMEKAAQLKAQDTKECSTECENHQKRQTLIWLWPLKCQGRAI
jgi:hypothetical protein